MRDRVIVTLDKKLYNKFIKEAKKNRTKAYEVIEPALEKYIANPYPVIRFGDKKVKK